jgi:hypothetical protein
MTEEVPIKGSGVAKYANKINTMIEDLVGDLLKDE